MYCVIAVAGYASVKFAAQKFKDRTLLLFGLSVELSNTLILLIIIPTASYRAMQLYVALVICVFLQVFCMAYLVVSSATMLSKFSPSAKQATIQAFELQWRHLQRFWPLNGLVGHSTLG